MKTAVIYWSQTGNTEALAKAAAEGAGVTAQTVSEFSGNVEEFDAFAFGCPAMGAEVLEEEENHLDPGDSIFNKLYPLGNGPKARQEKIFAAQSHVIQTLAERQSCIILGRCGDFVLQKKENAIHAYLYASIEERIKNCVEYLHMTEDEAGKVIPRAEKARNNYYLHYAGYEHDDPAHKHIMIDTGKFGIDGAVEILEGMVRKLYL